MAKKETALTKIETSDLLPLNPDKMEKVQAVLQENIGSDDAERPTAFDLPRIQIPAQGGTTWAIPTGLGDDETGPAFEAVIAAQQTCRAYWPGDFSGEEPPQCTSPDGITGYGEPGGSCGECPLAAFGSDSRGRGQACKKMRRLFLVRPGMVLPMVLTLPPSSLQNYRRYITKLSAAMMSFYGVVTRFELEATKNQDGIKYSEVTFSATRELSDTEEAAMKGYQQTIAPFTATPAAGADYAAGEGEGVEL